MYFSKYIFFIFLLSTKLFGEEFSLNVLPHGKEITLPSKVIIKFNTKEKIVLSATNKNQVIRFKALTKRNINLDIYLKEKKKTLNLMLKKGKPLFYSFNGFEKIAVTAYGKKRSKLNIFSNSPLSVSR